VAAGARDRSILLHAFEWVVAAADQDARSTWQRTTQGEVFWELERRAGLLWVCSVTTSCMSTREKCLVAAYPMFSCNVALQGGMGEVAGTVVDVLMADGGLEAARAFFLPLLRGPSPGGSFFLAAVRAEIGGAQLEGGLCHRQSVFEVCTCLP
jgi:hypothetical protein